MKDKKPGSPLRRQDAEITIKRLQKNLSYTNRVIELFLPPETSDVLDIMELVVKRGVSGAFEEIGQGMTLEQYVQYLSNLLFDALHTKKLRDEESFEETALHPEDVRNT